MKKTVQTASAVIMILSLLLLFAACGKSKSPGNRTFSETVRVTTEETTIEETQTRKEIRTDEKYVTALNEFKELLYLDYDEDVYDREIMAYFADLTGDGYEDVIYLTYWQPAVAIYKDGEFVSDDNFYEVTGEIYAGSIFPDGSKKAGCFIDEENGIVVIRDDGHTQGTAFYHCAAAFKFTQSGSSMQWQINSDEEKYISDSYDENLLSECEENFDEHYNEKIANYNLISFYDSYEPWPEESI